MSRVPDDTLLAAYRWARPVGFVALLLMVWGFAHGPAGAFLASAALYLPLALLLWEARRRAGGSKALDLWNASRGWSATEFKAGQGVEPQSEMFNDLAAIAKTRGYSVGEESGQWRRVGWTFTRASRDIPVP